MSCPFAGMIRIKEKRADERPVNELLTPVIDRYLSQHRPVLARSENASAALWLSANNGAPITQKEVARVIRRPTLAKVGVPVSPHMFRTSVAGHARLLLDLSNYLFIVLPNDLPEVFRSAHTRYAIVVLVGNARMRMVQKCAGEMRVIADVGGGGGTLVRRSENDVGGHMISPISSRQPS